MSVESAKRSVRACQARSTSASMSAGALSSPSSSASSRVIRGAIRRQPPEGSLPRNVRARSDGSTRPSRPRSGAAANTASKPSRQRGKRGAKPSSARAFALRLPRRSVLSSATALPATSRTTQAGRWRGGLAPASRATSGIQSLAAAGSSSVML